MWAEIITIKRTKDLNYFSLCALNLFNTRVSQFELNYWNKWTFPRHANLLRCTCINTYTYQGFYCIKIFSELVFVPAKLYLMWFMSDVNYCCACDSTHVNWGRECREPFSGPVYTWSLHAFFLIGQLSAREKTSPLNLKRFRDGFKSDRSNHMGRTPDETGQV